MTPEEKYAFIGALNVERALKNGWIMESIEETKRNILVNAERMAKLAESGYTVTIRKIKDGIKITSHKERVLK